MSVPNNVLNEPIRAGTVGPAGPVGPPGFQGPQGAAGNATTSTWADVLTNGNQTGATNPVITSPQQITYLGDANIYTFTGKVNVGQNNTQSGSGLIVGNQNTNAGTSTVVLGSNSAAGSSSAQSVVIGASVLAGTGGGGPDATNAVVIGNSSSVAVGGGYFAANSIAIGTNTNNRAGDSVAIGSSIFIDAGTFTASDNYCVAIGYNSTITSAAGRAISIGADNGISGLSNRSMIVGNDCSIVAAAGAGAFGVGCAVTNDYEYQIGNASNAASGQIVGHGAFRTLYTQSCNVEVSVNTGVPTSPTASQQTVNLASAFDVLGDMVSLPAILLPDANATYLVGCQGVWDVSAVGTGTVSLAFSGSIVGSPACLASSVLSSEITYLSCSTIVRTNGTTGTIELFRAQTSGGALNFLVGSNFWAVRIA